MPHETEVGQPCTFGRNTSKAHAMLAAAVLRNQGAVARHGKKVTGSVPVFTSHIVVVSVTTDTNVPNNTELEACATHVSYCCAMMNTLSAGGSAAISTAV